MEPRTEQLLAALEAHPPADERERRSRSRALALVRWLAAPFDETADPTHVTGSAIVVSPDGRVVLHRHKRLGLWLQPGGHVDGDESAADAAVRETREETGLVARHPDAGPRLVHVDLHEGPRGHVHLDVRYLLFADTQAGFAPEAGESPDVAWCSPQEAAARSDASLATAVRSALRAS
ncbi:NUDIX domain-containing protein [Nitriliruptoraceae bacterium ZYF776]|nr:NUDIX domain-containing protein [Profundirhabdus halotolerans]